MHIDRQKRSNKKIYEHHHSTDKDYGGGLSTGSISTEDSGGRLFSVFYLNVTFAEIITVTPIWTYVEYSPSSGLQQINATN